uniref:Uncharacterized protein n=1 Tax=Amphimedon queenslandica TaxID=400682 RepID=A0A1X7SRJ3_AMPQE
MKPLPPMNPSSSRVHFETKPTRQRRGKKSYSNSSVPKFQKKLVVFKYMSDHPNSFTRKDSYILLRGLLPEISINAKECEIRSDIISLLHNCQEFDLHTITEKDFEFIDVTGKHCVVPVCSDGQVFNGRSVKQMAGTGAVYIRLLKNLPSRNLIEISDDSDFEVHCKIEKHDTDSDSSFELPPVEFCSSKNVSAASNEYFPVNCSTLGTSSAYSAVSAITCLPIAYSQVHSTPSPVYSNTRSPVRSTTCSPIRSTTRSPVRSATRSPVRSITFSPVRSTTFSPVRSTTLLPIRSTTRSPVRSTTRSPVRSATRSPVRSITFSPVRSTTRSPIRSTTLLPIRSTTRSPVRSTTRSP